jgi:phenylacetaldehyde dehydrogenase
MPTQLYIDAAHVAPDKGYYDIINPATEDVAGEAPEASAAQVESAVDAASAAAASWAATAVEERAELVNQLGLALLRRESALVRLIESETGAVHAIAERMQFRHAAGFLTKWSRIESRDFMRPLIPAVTPASPSALIGAAINRAPVGVVGCITPFNFPLLCACSMVGPALVAGNPVVLKPAPADPLAVFALAEAATEVGLPPGVLNIVAGTDPTLGMTLVASPNVSMVSFTGSTGVGRQIASEAGRGMKRTLLELGGKGAAVVFEDADLDKAAAAIGSTWTVHSGQVCTAPTRVIAHRAIYDELIERLAAFGSALVVGDPGDPATVVGPVTTRAHLDRINAYIRSGTDQGGRLVIGGQMSSDRGFYAAPTLVADCSPHMTLVREEVFGPVVAAMPFATESEALALANDSSYGLYDYVWSANTSRAWEFARKLHTGYVGINTIARSPEAPFGGAGMSGIGRDGGQFSLEAYTESQSIVWA